MKNKGKGSKKVGRVERAKKRQVEFNKLSPEQQQEVKDKNKAEYDARKSAS